MIKILTIIGARPQIIKAAAINREIINNFNSDFKEIIVHTGQHYDNNMSEVFFKELNISHPDYNLNIGSANHGFQTAKMITEIEKLLIKHKPDFLLVYGDTNSTLAGALAASKIHIPVIHIEAGLRSCNKKMPEEINRIMCDHVSTFLFSPTKTAIDNLYKEGIIHGSTQPYSIDKPAVFLSGDVMYDNSLYFYSLAQKKSKIIENLQLRENEFVLATIHRDFNTDSPKRLSELLTSVIEISDNFKEDVVLPLHPRTSKKINENINSDILKKISGLKTIKIIPPVSFFDMIRLESNSKMIMTDSGGVQKEAYFFKKPVIILRPETEWVEIVENKTGIIADSNPERIIAAYKKFNSNENVKFPSIFGDGQASKFICEKILESH